jgi:hypothetical protein
MLKQWLHLFQSAGIAAARLMAPWTQLHAASYWQT